MTELACVESSTLCQDDDTIHNNNSMDISSNSSYARLFQTVPIYHHHEYQDTLIFHHHQQPPQQQQDIPHMTIRHSNNDLRKESSTDPSSYCPQHPRIRSLREHTRHFVPNEPYHRAHHNNAPHQHRYKNHANRRRDCIKIVPPPSVIIRNTAHHHLNESTLPQPGTHFNTMSTPPPSSIPIHSTSPQPPSKSQTLQPTSTPIQQQHQPQHTSFVPTPRTFTYQCSAHRGREKPQSALQNLSMMTTPQTTDASILQPPHQSPTVHPTPGSSTTMTMTDSSGITTPTSVRPKAVIFHGECFLCSGRHHSQNFCPLRQCSVCREYGHSHKVCTVTNRTGPTTNNTSTTSTNCNNNNNNKYHPRVRAR